MAVLTKTTICNYAIGHLGIGREFSNVDTDTNQESFACRLFYETAVRAVLRDWRWPFATKHADLFWMNDDPTTEWGYAYMYPADCLRFRRVLSGTRSDQETHDLRTPYRVVYGKATADRDGLALSQTPSGAGNLTLAGAWISDGAYTATEGRLVTIYSAANISTRTFTVTGTNRDGTAVVEVITGPNNTTVTGTTYFMTISTIAISGAAAGAVEVGMSTSYGKEIYTDQVDAVGEYTVYTSLNERFDHDFGFALSFRLAAMIAPRLTGGNGFGLVNRCLELYSLEMQKVKANSADEEQLDQYPQSEIIRARA